MCETDSVALKKVGLWQLVFLGTEICVFSIISIWRYFESNNFMVFGIIVSMLGMQVIQYSI
jgi:hypothetical protein